MVAYIHFLPGSVLSVVCDFNIRQHIPYIPLVFALLPDNMQSAYETTFMFMNVLSCTDTAWSN